MLKETTASCNETNSTKCATFVLDAHDVATVLQTCKIRTSGIKWKINVSLWWQQHGWVILNQMRLVKLVEQVLSGSGSKSRNLSLFIWLRESIDSGNMGYRVPLIGQTFWRFLSLQFWISMEKIFNCALLIITKQLLKITESQNSYNRQDVCLPACSPHSVHVFNVKSVKSQFW